MPQAFNFTVHTVRFCLFRYQMCLITPNSRRPRNEVLLDKIAGNDWVSQRVFRFSTSPVMLVHREFRRCAFEQISFHPRLLRGTDWNTFNLFALFGTKNSFQIHKSIKVSYEVNVKRKLQNSLGRWQWWGCHKVRWGRKNIGIELKHWYTNETEKKL